MQAQQMEWNTFSLHLKHFAHEKLKWYIFHRDKTYFFLSCSSFSSCSPISFYSIFFSETPSSTGIKHLNTCMSTIRWMWIKNECKETRSKRWICRYIQTKERWAKKKWNNAMKQPWMTSVLCLCSMRSRKNERNWNKLWFHVFIWNYKRTLRTRNMKGKLAMVLSFNEKISQRKSTKNPNKMKNENVDYFSCKNRLY